MDKFRKALGIALATMSALLTVPAFGASKFTTLTMTSPSDTTKTVVASIFNHSNPNSGGISNFSSLTLTVDSFTSGMLITTPLIALERVDQNNVATPVTGYTVSPASGTASTIAITGISPPIQAQTALRVTLTVTGCGAGIGWTATAYTGSNLTGNAFDGDPNQLPGQAATSVSCDSLACGTFVDVIRDPSIPNVTVQRGPYDSDGGCSTGATSTRIFVNNLIGTNKNSVLLTWPFGGASDADGEAAFMFDAKTSVLPGKTQSLAYKTYTTTSGTLIIDSGIPAFLPVNDGLVCNGSNGTDWFPRPYGVLAAAVKSSDKTIKVSTTLVSPFTSYVAWPTTFTPPIYLVVDDEVMQVTKINANTGTWTVTRVVDQPNGTTPPPHLANAAVMYTPLNLLSVAPNCLNVPLDSSGHALYACPYRQGELAKACVINANPGAGNPFKIMGVGDPVWSGGDL